METNKSNDSEVDYDADEEKQEIYKHKKRYQQKFLDSWLTHPVLESWLKKKITNGGKVVPYCKVCKSRLSCAKTALIRHAEAKTHKTRSIVVEGSKDKAEEDDISEDSICLADVVYVGVIHPCHFPVARMMIEAGKAVLCEKPLCMNLQETSELVRLARERKVFLMEGVWSRCFPVYKELQKRIQDGEIGELRQIMTSFGRPVQNLPKLAEKEQGGGLTLNIGTYTVQLVSFLMGGTRPLSINTGGILNNNGVDIAASSTLIYPKGRVATICTSAMCSLPGDALIVGSKGSIKINFPMWCPVSMDTPSGKFCVPLPNHGLTFNVPNAQGFIYEAEEIRCCLSKGFLESPLMTLDESIVIAEIMEKIRTEIGVSYAQDNVPLAPAK